ncbi:MAG TPA: Trm112 family protein [Rudaea sp.]|nr:Trm112 family protein [Rudaea sp.]
MDKRLLDILCCPATKQPLRPLTRAELDTLNRAIAGGGARTTAQVAVDAALAAGLITVDGKRVYRIEDDIPVMLADEAIVVAQLDGFPVR